MRLAGSLENESNLSPDLVPRAEMVRQQRNDALAQALRAASQAIEQAIGGAHRRPGTSLSDRHFVLAFKNDVMRAAEGPRIADAWP